MIDRPTEPPERAERAEGAEGAAESSPRPSTEAPAGRRRPAEPPAEGRLRDEDRLLLRLLTDPRGEKGDLSPAQARELRRRLETEAELATRFERLAAPWRVVEPPPVTLPPGFTGRVMARVEEEGRRAPSLLSAPVRVRSLATLALVVGLLVGLAAGPLSVGRLADTPPDLAPVEIAETLEAGWLEDTPSLAESYLWALGEETGEPAGAGSGEPEPGSDDSRSGGVP